MKTWKKKKEIRDEKHRMKCIIRTVPNRTECSIFNLFFLSEYDSLLINSVTVTMWMRYGLWIWPIQLPYARHTCGLCNFHKQNSRFSRNRKNLIISFRSLLLPLQYRFSYFCCCGCSFTWFASISTLLIAHHFYQIFVHRWRTAFLVMLQIEHIHKHTLTR